MSDLTILSATLEKPIDFSASADFLEISSGVLYSRVRQLPLVERIIADMALPENILIVGGGVFGREYRPPIPIATDCDRTPTKRVTFTDYHSINRPLPLIPPPNLQSNAPRILPHNPQPRRLLRRHFAYRPRRLLQPRVLEARRRSHRPLAQHRMGR